MDNTASTVDCTNCEYKSSPVKLLNHSELEAIEKNCNIVKINKGELIFKQGAPATYVLYIRKGLVKISNKNSNNKELIVQLLKPGNYMGLTSILCGEIYYCSAITVEPSEICFINKDIFLELIEFNGTFGKKIIEYTSKLELLQVKRLYSLIHKQVPGRIADLFLYLSREIYNNNEFIIPLNRIELANFIGTSKKSVINTLSEFNNDRLIEINGRKIKILCMDLIERLSKIG